MAGTDNAAVTLASLQISISVEEIHDLGLDRMRKQSMRSMAQDIGELIGECSWLNQFRNGIFRHGISLLQWRSGGVKHPHDMPPYRFTPSPTFGHSSATPTELAPWPRHHCPDTPWCGGGSLTVARNAMAIVQPAHARARGHVQVSQNRRTVRAARNGLAYGPACPAYRLKGQARRAFEDRFQRVLIFALWRGGGQATLRRQALLAPSAPEGSRNRG